MSTRTTVACASLALAILAGCEVSHPVTDYNEVTRTTTTTTTTVASLPATPPGTDPLHGGPPNDGGGYWCPDISGYRGAIDGLDYIGPENMWTLHGEPFAYAEEEDTVPYLFYCDPTPETIDWFRTN